MEGEANEEAGEKPSEGDADEKFREKEDDQGIPPELAKLGVSSSDWEKIKAAMSREVGGARRSLVPEDYRGLVRDYFRKLRLRFLKSGRLRWILPWTVV